MKNIITVLALSVFMTSPAIAVNPFCDIVLSYATSIMEARQAGVSVQKMMTVADESEAASDMMRAMTTDAYSQSKYDSPAIQKTVVENFAHKHYLNCVQRSQ